MVKLREKGIDDLAKVRMARMESDGEISVIEQEDGERKSTPSEDTSRRKF